LFPPIRLAQQLKEDAVSQSNFSGGCLCGAVQYEISGEARRFYHCHCRRCRKATGTGHASNLMVRTSSVTWTSGEALLGRYNVPEAERFATCFCTQCGSPLPRVIPELGIVVVPAGSLDSEPPMQPQARIFWDSRAPWSCSAGELPVFAEYPTQGG
jgi:hypothetical protein